jgi:hypothetical protein
MRRFLLFALCLAAALDGFVQKAAQVALESPEALAGVDGYTTLWQDTALLLMADRDGLVEDDQAAEVAVAKSFGAARYGYAIESHACAQALGGALPDGYAYQLQASRGMTRPDIVVFDDSKAEVGWFDITSEGSLGHIDLKTGSSWKTKPYVAEFTYPPLDVSHLGTGKLSIGEKVKIRNAVRRRKKNWQDFVNTKCASFLGRWKYNGGPTDTAKSTKKSTARFSLETVFPGLAATDSVATSLLRAFGLTVSQFGYSSGGSKATGEAILRDYEDV